MNDMKQTVGFLQNVPLFQGLNNRHLEHLAKRMVNRQYSAGQPIVTLVNPDSLWVRADIEETYIDRVRLGDTLTVRLPSGAERKGTVIYRGVDADFATQRDVSRTKRDIKTFEVRLRVDNSDRRLAVGMTSYVLLPAPHS